MRARRWWLVSAVAMAASSLVAGGCGEDATTGTGDGEDTADGVLFFDTLLPDVEVVEFDTVAPADTQGGDAEVVFGDTSVAPDGGGDVDASGCGGGTGCPCQGNGDCLDERCVESVDGRVCTKRCTTECPDGYDCLTTAAFGDPESLCVPRHTRLCRPCRADAECQSPFDDAPGYCVAASDPDVGSFCGSSCAGGRSCPEGYQCANTPTKGGGTALQCVPMAGTCACRPSWAGLGYTTACGVRNGIGVCEGSRGCGEFGLEPCVGPQASPEICDEVDNDCNGVTDDIAATPCLVQNLFGACPGTLACGPGRTPVCEGAAAAPEACDGLDNDCNGTTDERGCDDGLSCTVDSCDAPFSCSHVLAAGFCAIDGGCWAAGAYKPGDACSVCNPAKATTAWSAAPSTCEIAGQCYPANAVNPANPCQVCDPTQSAAGWSQAQSTCLIQGQCFAAGAQKAGQTCLRCVPEQNPSGWTTAASNTSCDDGSACSTDDHCDGSGVCVGNKSCDDGVACTLDQCTAEGCQHSGVTAGWCRIGGGCYTNGTANPQNPCQRCLSSASQTTWTAQPTSVACSDGNACTAGDHCDGAGQCTPGPGCWDGLSCTTDTCNPAVGCSYPTASGKCKIGDVCYSNGDTRPNNVCFRCNAGATQSDWSFNNGASCNDGNACTSGDTCGGGACNGSPIVDGYEPNESLAGARQLTNKEDRNDWPQDSSTLTANLYPNGDEDWFKYKIADTNSPAQPHARVELTGIPAGTDYDLCVYWKCDDPGDEESVDCNIGQPSFSNGRRGCCSVAPTQSGETVRFTPGCDNAFLGDDDTGTVYIRVYRASGSPTCSNYSLRYGDD